MFYPIPLTDALEITVSKKTTLFQSGLSIASKPEDNLVMKAYTELSKKCKIPPFNIYLKKAIPSEAGLGGGSSDATFLLKSVNRLCGLGLSDDELENIAANTGADCPFFIRNKPVIAKGTGNIFTPADISLKGLTICVVKPPVKVSTRKAYSMIKPEVSSFNLEQLPSIPVSEWKNVIRNDFERVVFDKYPVISEIKDVLYKTGAQYACMSGSGSAVYGLFEKTVSPCFPNCFVWTGILE